MSLRSLKTEGEGKSSEGKTNLELFMDYAQKFTPAQTAWTVQEIAQEAVLSYPQAKDVSFFSENKEAREVYLPWPIFKRITGADFPALLAEVKVSHAIGVALTLKAVMECIKYTFVETFDELTMVQSESGLPN
jgi:hypothetical protein